MEEHFSLEEAMKEKLWREKQRQGAVMGCDGRMREKIGEAI